MPWCWNTAVEGPVGTWIIEFMEKLLARPFLNYTLSAWWFCNAPPTAHHAGPPVLRLPRTYEEGAEMWCVMLREWKRRFGFDRLVYFDLANEVPFFFPGFQERLKAETGAEWDGPVALAGADPVRRHRTELRPALAAPRVSRTALHLLDPRRPALARHPGGIRLPRRAFLRRRRSALGGTHALRRVLQDGLFTKDAWHAEFSKRCAHAHSAIAPMLRARQRHKLAQFAAWAKQRGAPLTTTESWSSWFYLDSPGLDWGWLLDWASWSVEDAIDYGMWGWTPHNYLQPQFKNWQDVKWHQKLTSRFLES